MGIMLYVRSLNTYGREMSLKKECKFVTKKQLPSIANKLMIGSSLYVRVSGCDFLSVLKENE